jgi:hypothetical protein
VAATGYTVKAVDQARRRPIDMVKESRIVTIIHELLAETCLGQPDSGTLVRSGPVRRSASALVHLPLRSLSRDAMPSLRDGVHTDKPSIPKGPQMQRLQK